MNCSCIKDKQLTNDRDLDKIYDPVVVTCFTYFRDESTSNDRTPSLFLFIYLSLLETSSIKITLIFHCPLPPPPIRSVLYSLLKSHLHCKDDSIPIMLLIGTMSCFHEDVSFRSCLKIPILFASQNTLCLIGSHRPRMTHLRSYLSLLMSFHPYPVLIDPVVSGTIPPN